MAFVLTLSKRQCNTLLRLDDFDGDERTLVERERERLWIISVDGLNSIHRKGLVFWKADETGRPNGFGGLTDEGRLVVKLLKCAGLGVKETNTAMIDKRVERLAARDEERRTF